MATALFPDLVINGELVPHSVVAAEAQNHSAPRGKPGLAWRAAANAIAIRTLLLQEANGRGIQPEPLEVSPGKFETRDEALIRQLLDAAVRVAPPDEAALHAEWDKDPSRFKTPPLWEVSHILCACDPREESQRARAQDRARSLTQLAIGNPGGFSALAAQHSDCDSKSSGGALGQLRPGDTVPEFEAAIRDLEEGQITPEPVATRFGYHVIRLDAVAEAQILPFETARQKISDAMEKAAWAREARSFVNQLIESAEISGAELKSARGV